MQPHLTGVWQAVRSRTAAPPRGAGCLGALALWLLLAGCSPQNIDDAYGKRRGAVGGASVNGTAVLAEMFRAAGHRVISWRRLSPKLYGFDILVWVPDDDHPPELPQRQFLEDWLGRRGGRTLVYVGHDYDAAVDYWQKARPRRPRAGDGNGPASGAAAGPERGPLRGAARGRAGRLVHRPPRPAAAASARVGGTLGRGRGRSAAGAATACPAGHSGADGDRRVDGTRRSARRRSAAVRAATGIRRGTARHAHHAARVGRQPDPGGGQRLLSA